MRQPLRQISTVSEKSDHDEVPDGFITYNPNHQNDGDEEEDEDDVEERKNASLTGHDFSSESETSAVSVIEMLKISGSCFVQPETVSVDLKNLQLFPIRQIATDTSPVSFRLLIF